MFTRQTWLLSISTFFYVFLPVLDIQFSFPCIWRTPWSFYELINTFSHVYLPLFKQIIAFQSALHRNIILLMESAITVIPHITAPHYTKSNFLIGWNEFDTFRSKHLMNNIEMQLWFNIYWFYLFYFTYFNVIVPVNRRLKKKKTFKKTNILIAHLRPIYDRRSKWVVNK